MLLAIALSGGAQVASAAPLDLRLGDIRRFISPEESPASLDDAMTLRADFGGSPGPSLG